MPYLYHSFVSTKTDSADSGLVRPTNWNDRLEYSNAGNTGPSGTDATVREVLTAARTYYVLTTGSDSNTGLVNTAGGAFLTIQKAWDTIVTLDLAGFAVTVQVGNGTYTDGLNATVPPVGGLVTFVGDTTTPSNVVISTTSADAFKIGCVASVGIGGFKLATTTSGECLSASGVGAGIYITGKMEFGATADAHLYALNTGVVTCQGSDYTISGGGGYHMLSQKDGKIIHGFQTVTLTGTPAFSQAFASANPQAYVESLSTTWTGSATGTRYAVFYQSLITTGGGGANYFPGNGAGTADAATFSLYA